MNDEKTLFLVGIVGILGLAITFTLLFNSGCATGKVIASDASVCAKSEVASAVASATTDFLSAAAGSNGSQNAYLQVGTSLALKYGTDVAVCTIEKVWADLGGAKFIATHMQPSKELVAADYLLRHRGLWGPVK